MIEPAGHEHAGALAAIHAAAFPPGQTWDAASLAALLALPGVFALADRRGGMVIARIAADQAEIITLAVAPASRRRGIGAALLDAAVARAAAGGAASLSLEVATTAVAARALYHAAGFAQIGRRTGYYADGGDALVLKRALSPGAAAPG